MYISQHRKCTWSLRKERWFPFVLAIFSGALICKFKNNFIISSLLFSSSISFGAIITGFSATCLAVLIGLDSDIMRKIRQTQRILPVLSEYMGFAMFSGLLFSSLGILGLLLFDEDLNCLRFQNVLLPMWSASLAFCLSCLCRLGRIMLKIFSSPSNF